MNDIENKVVCNSCQKALREFSVLVASWTIANNWNVGDEMKVGADIVMLNLKEENSDNLSNCHKISLTKDTNVLLATTKIKSEGDEVPSESALGISKEIKQECEEVNHWQLKNEEIVIKQEDE